MINFLSKMYFQDGNNATITPRNPTCTPEEEKNDFIKTDSNKFSDCTTTDNLAYNDDEANED